MGTEGGQNGIDPPLSYLNQTKRAPRTTAPRLAYAADARARAAEHEPWPSCPWPRQEPQPLWPWPWEPVQPWPEPRKGCRDFAAYPPAARCECQGREGPCHPPCAWR